MKFIVCVDCEGVACVVSEPGKMLGEGRQNAYASLQATREANAAAQGFFDAGATEVIVWDCHGRSLNLDYDLLDERCKIVLGVGFERRLPGLDGTFAGIALIGHHAMEGTPDGVLCHTMSSVAYQYQKLNGIEVGEMAIEGAIAGDIGVPVVFVSSDDKGVAEARRFFPGIETVQTKIGLGFNAALSEHPLRILKTIRAGAKAAAAKAKTLKPYRIPGPVVHEIRYKRIESAQSSVRADCGWERVDAFTVRRTAKAVANCFF
ncbi:MAG: M55 family metallopeptidase [Planctomycetota bacterium]